VLYKYSTLQPKDVEYLTFILRNGIVTHKQVMLKFQENHVNQAYRRLQKLTNQGYLVNKRIASRLGVYYATTEARQQVEAEVTVPKSVSLNIAQHTLLLTDLLLFYEYQFKQKGIPFSYHTERELRYRIVGQGSNQEKLRNYNNRRDRIPDALFFVKRSDDSVNRIWIELELTKKENKRYRDKFRMFERVLSEGEYDNVFYFTHTGHIRNTINRMSSDLTNGHRILVKDIPDAILNDKWEEVTNLGTPDGESGTTAK
jgi:hypothetical protein